MRLRVMGHPGILLALGLLISTAAPVQAAPRLEVLGVSPAFSPFSAAGRTVTVKGIGFTASTTVTIDGTPAPTTFVDSRTLLAEVPTGGSARVADLVATDPSNGTDSFFPFLYTGPVVYVSEAGSDSNNGASPATALRTIGAGFEEADGVTPTEIRVTGGAYPESELAIPNAAALSCGWDPNFALRDPDRNVTDIDGLRSGWVIRTFGLENVSVIDGCTIRNGLRDGFGGGGLVISADSLVVNNSVIAGNTSTIMGGGAYFVASTSYGGRPTFSNNVLVGNRAHNKNGGGIVVYPNYNTQQEVRVNVTGNQIVGNRSFRGRGGGVALTTGSYAGYNTAAFKVSDNLIGFNRAKTGGALDLALLTGGDFIDLTLENNLAIGNAVPGAGGGLSLQGVGIIDGAVASSTAASNSAGPGLGGGFILGSALTLGPAFEATDLILWNNVGGDAAGQAVFQVTYSLAGETMPGVGNLNADPAFDVGPLGGFYLRQGDPNLPDSPALDAGSGSAVDLSMEILTTRIDGAADTGTVDMGYHFRPAPPTSVNPIAVTRVDPPEGDLHGNDWVLVRGDGFVEGVSLAFGGVDATEVLFLGETRVLAKPAAHGLGDVTVRVTNPDASFAELPVGYRYLDNEPPVWSTTVGLVSAVTAQDACQRSVVLEWNQAVDTTSEPVVYEIYKEECLDSLNTSIPCDNFGYIPNATNYLGTTLETSWIDVGFAAGGQDKEWLYTVRARDSAAFRANKEWNFAKRLVLGSQGLVEVPPDPVGATLAYVPGSLEEFDWAAPAGALGYNLYRETDPSVYAIPASLVPFAVLDPLNNDANGDGVTDPTYTDGAVPAMGEAFYYRVASTDPCGTENPADF